jgi:hypothetical protein
MYQLEGFIPQGKEDYVCVYWRSHCIAWNSHQDNGVKGLILLCLNMVTLWVTMTILYILGSF